MSWVLLALRKTELQHTHSELVYQEMQLSRESRQMARHYQYEQLLVKNDQSSALRACKSTYDATADAIREEIKTVRGGGTVDDGNGNSLTLDDLYDLLDAAKEDYQLAVNTEKDYWESELATLEEEANDIETQYQDDKTVIETQMEAVSQELQAVGQAISQEIQQEVIKLS